MSIFYEDDRKRIHKIVASPYANNCYIIVCKTTNSSAIIDAPIEYEKIIRECEGTDVEHILITHNHFDHLEGFKELRNKFNKASIGVGKTDEDKLPENDAVINLFTKDEHITIGTLQVTAIITPGHTPGSTCYLLDKHLFSGDTLFPGGPGRTGSSENFTQILSSITTKLFNLESDTIVLPGHGETTTIQDSKDEYKIFREQNSNQNLFGDVTWLNST